MKFQHKKFKHKKFKHKKFKHKKFKHKKFQLIVIDPPYMQYGNTRLTKVPLKVRCLLKELKYELKTNILKTDHFNCGFSTLSACLYCRKYQIILFST